jgi:hypothetical protein
MNTLIAAMAALAAEIIDAFGPAAVQALVNVIKGQKSQPLTTQQAETLESLAADAAAAAIARG